ncbi:MAG: hypothetical protein EXS05_05705 [Planctomycetaceae bacterium]|nr:hypothetical protein [Planctomycetaceae bacterium]
MSDYLLGAPAVADRSQRFRLWIDRVGVFLVCLGDSITIGGPAADGAADVSLLANLSRRHATLSRSGERYVIYAHAPVLIAGRPLHERADLCDGNELQLGGSVRLRFRLPCVMSGSARLDFLSDHRPAYAADAVVLMHDTCLLGPAAENHIVCPDWPQSLLLYRQGGALCCKSRDDLFIDGRHSPGGGELPPGTVVTATDIRFRLETIS